MPKFKKGDRVRYVGTEDQMLVGRTGVVLEDSGIPYVEWDGLTTGGHGPYKDKRRSCRAVPQFGMQLLDDPKEPPKVPSVIPMALNTAYRFEVATNGGIFVTALGAIRGKTYSFSSLKDFVEALQGSEVDFGEAA